MSTGARLLDAAPRVDGADAYRERIRELLEASSFAGVIAEMSECAAVATLAADLLAAAEATRAARVTRASTSGAGSDADAAKTNVKLASSRGGLRSPRLA